MSLFVSVKMYVYNHKHRDLIISIYNKTPVLHLLNLTTSNVNQVPGYRVPKIYPILDTLLRKVTPEAKAKWMLVAN